MRHESYMFREHDIRDVFRGQLNHMQKLVEEVPERQFIQSSDEEIVEHIYSKLQIIPIVLHDDQKDIDTDETKIDVGHDPTRLSFGIGGPAIVPGTIITIRIPFTGESDLFKFYTNPFGSGVRGTVITKDSEGYNGFITLEYEKATDRLDDGSALKREIDGELSRIKERIDELNHAVESHNQSLRSNIQFQVDKRREILGKHDEIVKVLDIPLRRDPNAPEISKRKLKRRIVKPLPDKPKKQDEQGISDDDYEFILKVIRHEGSTFESASGTFSMHGEEGLRDILLAHLNGHYEGEATGETFRTKGKTDIRIEFENRAAFIGECKVWGGPKRLSEAIEQLLGYLTWRDCKTALILFNKGISGFKEIQEKVPEVLSKHPNHIRVIDETRLGEWRFKFKSANDPDREITVHVFLFDLYVKKTK